MDFINGFHRNQLQMLSLAEKWKEKAPKLSPYFNLKIANIALESNTKRKRGLKAIQEYIKDYEEGLYINLERAKEIEQKLNR